MSKRCFGTGNKLYEDYHDFEWGKPVHDDRLLFEMLILEGTQAGLSWEIVLNKRAAYKKAFHNFEPKKVSTMSDQELEECLKNPDLIRNRLKIFAARKNAKVFLQIQDEYGTFDKYLWDYVDGCQRVNQWDKLQEVPCLSPLSEKVGKDLKKRGMTFVGPKIIYSYLQAVGLINDHLSSCPCKT